MAVMVQLPAFYGFFEVGLLLFLIVVFSIYRTRVITALKEFFYDVVFAIIFTGAGIAMLGVTQSTLVTIMFFGSLSIIFASRILYSKYFKPTNQPPPPQIQF